MKAEKIFLLFGASGDLGKAAAQFFLNEQYDKYYFFARHKLESIEGNKNIKTAIVDDLSNEENVKTAFSKVDKNLDAKYFLFNTVGGFFGGKNISETEYKDWQKMLNINLNSSFLVSKYFMQLVSGTKGGSICFVSAYSSFKPEANKAAYNVSKNALNFLVKTLALEGKEFGISANAVAPLIIDTPANREWVKNLSQMVSPNDICEIVSSLFKNYNTVTGNIIELPETLS